MGVRPSRLLAWVVGAILAATSLALVVTRERPTAAGPGPATPRSLPSPAATGPTRAPTASAGADTGMASPEPSAEAGSPSEVGLASAASTAARLPESLGGTDVDGGLSVDDNGHFRPTAEARLFFDYFLTATGEEPDQQVSDRVVAAVRARLKEPAAGEAVALFERYLRYRERGAALDPAGRTPEELDERLAELRRLRTQTLGPEAAWAFFGGEEEEDQAALERRRAALPKPRSGSTDAGRPEGSGGAWDEATLALRLKNSERALTAAGGAAEDVRRLRESWVGPEAADRLAALEASRREWSRRFDSYLRARAALEADGSLAPEERAAAVKKLLEERFPPSERARVQALESMRSAAPRSPRP